MKKRMDILLVEKGLAASREKAKTMIIEGIVSVANVPVKNPSDTYEEDVEISITGKTCPYVSRGGYKLEKAIDEFDLDLKGCVGIDIGASTGGFTDCMLQNGASYVYAVDVGYGQFDWKLRNDERVTLYERTNARYLTAEMFDKAINIASIDVSFISLKLILPVFDNINMADGFKVIALIKPQFEAGKNKVGKKGVVREASTHIEVIENVLNYSKELGFAMTELTYSPVKGPNGNIEFLCSLEKNKDSGIDLQQIKNIVELAHNSLV